MNNSGLHEELPNKCSRILSTVYEQDQKRKKRFLTSSTGKCYKLDSNLERKLDHNGLLSGETWDQPKMLVLWPYLKPSPSIHTVTQADWCQSPGSQKHYTILFLTYLWLKQRKLGCLPTPLPQSTLYSSHN